MLLYFARCFHIIFAVVCFTRCSFFVVRRAVAHTSNVLCVSLSSLCRLRCDVYVLAIAFAICTSQLTTYTHILSLALCPYIRLDIIHRIWFDDLLTICVAAS